MTTRVHVRNGTAPGVQQPKYCEHDKLELLCIPCNFHKFVCQKHKLSYLDCWECNPTRFCPHRLVKGECVDCEEAAKLCPHQLEKVFCLTCTRFDFCEEHKTPKSECAVCHFRFNVLESCINQSDFSAATEYFAVTKSGSLMQGTRAVLVPKIPTLTRSAGPPVISVQLTEGAYIVDEEDLEDDLPHQEGVDPSDLGFVTESEEEGRSQPSGFQNPPQQPEAPAPANSPHSRKHARDTAPQTYSQAQSMQPPKQSASSSSAEMRSTPLNSSAVTVTRPRGVFPPADTRTIPLPSKRQNVTNTNTADPQPTEVRMYS